MNKEITATDLQGISEALVLLEDKQATEQRLKNIGNERLSKEYRDSIPFSYRLNNWLLAWWHTSGEMFEFTDEDLGSYEAVREYYKCTGKIKIWTGGSDSTIYASPELNHYARAWHDYVHIHNDLPFDLAGEVAVANIQMCQLPPDWEFEKRLINCEVVGQVLYHNKYNEFVKDQRTFTLQFLKYGTV